MKYLYSMPRRGTKAQAPTESPARASEPRWMAVVPSDELDQEFGGTRTTTRPADGGNAGIAPVPNGTPKQTDASRPRRGRAFPRDPRGRFVPDNRFGPSFVGPPVPPGIVVGPGLDGNVYRFGFTNEYDFGRFYTESNARTEMVLQHHAGHLTNGLKLFRQRRYAEAADGFRLAADTNHGDPSSRLYAAHALFAMGRYAEAVPYLRRAFELQPKIVFLNFDIRDDYGDQKDFQSQLAALEAALGSRQGISIA